MEFLCLDCCKTFLTALTQRKRYNSHLEQYQSLESGRDCERHCQASLLMKSFIFFLGFIKNKWFYPSIICHKLNNEKKAKTFDIRCLFTPVIISCYYEMNGLSPEFFATSNDKISLRGFVHVSSKNDLLELSRPIRLNSPVSEQ